MQFLLTSSVILLWIVVLLNLFLTFGIIRRMNNQSSTQADPYAPERLQKGDAAPDFIAATLAGQQVSLATYAGKPVVFLFFSTHCGPCRAILPDLLEAAPLAAQANVELVFVLLSDAEKVRAFVAEFQLSLPVLVAPLESNDFAKDYKSTATPSYCLVDGQGFVQAAGYPKNSEWQKAVESWKRPVMPTPAMAIAERR